MIIKLYQDGVPYKQIMEQTDCAEKTISETIKRNNIPMRGRNTINCSFQKGMTPWNKKAK